MSEAKKPGVSLYAYDLAMAEMLAIHHFMDKRGVPQFDNDGSQMSAAQRVAAYCGHMRGIYGEEGARMQYPDHTAH